MNAQMLLENFGLIVNAMDGINRIRDVVLSLAFQGKLAKHSSIHVDDLLTSIDELEPRSKRRQRSLTDAVIGYHSIPSHWRWVTMDQIGYDWGQTKPISNFTYIDVSSIDNKRGVISESPKIITAAAAPSRARKVVKKGTVIYSTVRPYLRNIVVVDQDFEPEPIASTAFAILHPFEGIEAKYIYYYLRSPAFVAYVESVQSGIAYPAISDQKFFASALPLAPTEEQKRIVAKVDELMALCDKLEAQQQERERRFPVLSRACHARFVESPSLDNLRAILDGAFSPDDLRDTILSLAVQGKITRQNEKEKNYSTLEGASEIIVDCPHSTPKWTESGKICVRTNQIQPGYLDLSQNRFVSNETYKERTKRLIPRKDDILYSREGGILGVACRVPADTELCLGQRMMLIRSGKNLVPAFLELVLNSPMITKLAREKTTGGAAPRVNMSTVRKYPIPIPSLDEQHRIVAKVDQLMALIDKLEQQQARKSELAQAFAQAAVAAITGTEIKEPEKMKAPKTELVSRLQARNTPNATDSAPLTKLLADHNGELPAKALWQRSGLEIDAFYQQLRTEMANGWIIEPEKAVMKEIEAD